MKEPFYDLGYPREDVYDGPVCDRCGLPSCRRYVVDGVALCPVCLTDWAREEPAESLSTIIANTTTEQLADLLGALRD